MRRIWRLVLHHSAGPSGNAEVFRALHKKRGWVDVGYHEILPNGNGGPDGQIQRGRPHSKVGAGVAGNNAGALHCCLVGDFTETRPTHRQLAALGHWLLVNLWRYGPDAGRAFPSIQGHREVALPGHGTECPGSLPLGLIRRWAVENRDRWKTGEHEGLAEWLERET